VWFACKNIDHKKVYHKSSSESHQQMGLIQIARKSIHYDDADSVSFAID
jgi:hypothetical protein